MQDQRDKLLPRARQFDVLALAEIYDSFSSGLYAYSWRLLGDTGLAEECVSETFARFLNALHRGNGPHSHLQAYLYRIAHNWITDCYRRQPPPCEPLEDDLSPNASERLEDQVEERFCKKQIREALADLTADQRQVLTLVYLEGWDKEDVAMALGKQVGAVKALQHRAICSLRRKLRTNFDETEDEPIKQFARSAP